MCPGYLEDLVLPRPQTISDIYFGKGRHIKKVWLCLTRKPLWTDVLFNIREVGTPSELILKA